MAQLNNKGPLTGLGLCRCCGSTKKCRLLNVEYEFYGQKEVYSDMFFDCFGIMLSHLDGDYKERLICATCVTRLREASSFHQQVLQCEDLLQSKIHVHSQDGEMDKDIKVEVTIKTEASSSDLHNDVTDNDVGTHTTIKKEATADSIDEGTLPGKDNEAPTEEGWLTENLKQEPETEQFEEVEYLEEDVSIIPGSSMSSHDQESDYEPTKKKIRTNKNYTDVELKLAIAAVQNKKLSLQQASQLYNIPRETLRVKMVMGENVAKDISTTKLHLKFVREIQTILKYTNATPFKSRTARLLCAYCSPKGQIFEVPEELRVHTRTKHSRERIRNLEIIMRPAWTFETLRIDIFDLQCTVCCTALQSWQDMYNHLEIIHKVTLELTHKKLIPYILTDLQYLCALCDNKYNSYYHLDIHMNNHFQNHLCLECGDPFITETRLKKHLKKHQVGQYPCEVCGIVFRLKNYKKKHFENQHTKISKIKCIYCNERFQGEYQRHLHVVEKHKEKVRTYTCSICERDYTWHPYYLKHLKYHHTKTKECECNICVQKFDTASDRRHTIKIHKKLFKPNYNIKLLRMANDELVRKSRDTRVNICEVTEEGELFQEGKK